jgi:hypothetical protein
VDERAIELVKPIRHILDRCLVHDHSQRISMSNLKKLLDEEFKKY